MTKNLSDIVGRRVKEVFQCSPKQSPGQVSCMRLDSGLILYPVDSVGRPGVWRPVQGTNIYYHTTREATEAYANSWILDFSADPGRLVLLTPAKEIVQLESLERDDDSLGGSRFKVSGQATPAASRGTASCPSAVRGSVAACRLLLKRQPEEEEEVGGGGASRWCAAECAEDIGSEVANLLWRWSQSPAVAYRATDAKTGKRVQGVTGLVDSPRVRVSLDALADAMTLRNGSIVRVETSAGEEDLRVDVEAVFPSVPYARDRDDTLAAIRDTKAFAALERKLELLGPPDSWQATFLRTKEGGSTLLLATAKSGRSRPTLHKWILATAPLFAAVVASDPAGAKMRAELRVDAAALRDDFRVSNMPLAVTLQQAEFFWTRRAPAQGYVETEPEPTKERIEILRPPVKATLAESRDRTVYVLEIETVL